MNKGDRSHSSSTEDALSTPSTVALGGEDIQSFKPGCDDAIGHRPGPDLTMASAKKFVRLRVSLYE